MALDQIPKRTGRAAAIEDIDLNLFTGRLAIKNFRLDEPTSAEAFVTAERLDVRIAPMALLRSDIRVAELGLVAPSIRVVRTGANEFNFSDLLRRGDDAPPPAPSRWTVTLDRLTVSRGSVLARDQVVAPPAEWAVQDLGIDVRSLTTRAGAAPGRASLQAKINEAALDVTAEPLRLDPLTTVVKGALEGFEIRRLNPYVWAATPYRPTGGRLALAFGATVDHEGDELTKAAITATVNVDHQAGVARAGYDDPFFGVSRLAVELKEADLIARTLTVASVAIDGLDLKARRDAKGVIDLVDMFLTKAPKAAGPSAARSAAAPAGTTALRPPSERKLFPVLKALAAGFEQILVERITLGPSRATFVDESVKPTTTLALTTLQATVTDLTWPPQGPAKLVFSTALPGGGTLDINGPVVPQPLDVDLVFKLRNAPVTPYQAYIPVPAQLSGRFNGDSRNRITQLKDGQMLLASTGTSWGQNIEIRAPGAARPSIRVEHMELVGIDFDWPRRGAVRKAGFRRPHVEVVRQADGSFDIRELFTTTETSAGTPTASPAAAPKPAPPAGRQAKPKNVLDTMKLDIKQVRVEEGTIRFLDRTTKPAFSQDLSKLDVTVTNINNRPGERAQVAVQSIVGGDSTFDVRGEVSSIGSPPFIDLVGELRRFQLPSVDPYAENAIGWIIRKGELEYKVRFKLDGDELDTTNQIVVGKLQVAPAVGTDEVKHRIGLPLGMIVALVKDGKGEIRANVPVTGSLKDPKFDLRETIWTAVKNVLFNIVKAPFQAIAGSSRQQDKVEEPKVAPVTFAAGSSVLVPDMEEHLLRVADFLRRAPFVNLELTPMASPSDVETLKAEAVNTRLREFQEERGLKEDAAVIGAYFEAHLPDVTLPPAPEEQLAMLREREPAPEGALDALARRRVEATRERLISVEGIPAERLALAEAKESALPTEESALPRRAPRHRQRRPTAPGAWSSSWWRVGSKPRPALPLHDHQFQTPVLGPPLLRVVGRHQLLLSITSAGDARRANAPLNHELLHREGAVEG